MMDQAKPLWPLIGVSLGLAGAAFFTGRIGMGTPFAGLLFTLSFALSFGWVVSLLIGIVTRRWRGLWLLLGLPAALVWPVLLGPILICIATSQKDCLP
jgi:hypothetical protein